MNINRNNYELYFLDYYEKSLSAEKQAALLLFLEENPDLKREFENFELINIPSAGEIKFPYKDILKKNIVTIDNYEQFLIANLEGELNDEEQKWLEGFLQQYPELKKEETLFNITRLTADMDVVYENKAALKHPVPISGKGKSVYYYSIAVAACLFLLVGVYFITSKKTANNVAFRGNDSIKNETVSAQKHEKNNAPDHSNPILRNKHLQENNKPVLAQHASSEKHIRNSEKLLVKKDAIENLKNTFRSDEMISKISSLEITHIEFTNDLQMQIAYVNIRLLRQEELPNSLVVLNDLLDEVINPDEKNNTGNIISPEKENSSDMSPKKSMLDMLAWGVSKVSKEDVMLKKQYDKEGQLVAYGFETGIFRFGKLSEK